MAKDVSRNIRLGIMVIAGTIFLILALYLIGNKRNLFGNTFTLHASFRDVNGLMPGNNVRLSGIDVGTVDNVYIVNDTSVLVTMVVELKVQPYIRKNAIAIIGTDGLMGNKLVNINSAGTVAAVVENNDTLRTLEPVGMDEMTRTLSVTNENMKVITDNLRKITGKIDNSNSLWSLLSDTTMAENVREAIVSLRITGQNSAIATGDLSAIVKNVQEGKGTLGALITDTTLNGQLKQSIVNVQLVSDRLAILSGDLSDFSKHVKSGQGAMGTILMDTTFAGNLNKTMESAKNGAEGFNQDMEALKHSFLLRKYFKKQEKQKASDGKND